MIKYLFNKLFLVKEGELHFLRYRLFSCPWFRIYIHKICLPDYDLHMHGHPWNYISYILSGSYYERYRIGPNYSNTYNEVHEPGAKVKHSKFDVHQIEQIMQGPVWTLVFAYGKYQDWGYRLRNPNDGNRFTTYVDHKNYRKMKNEGKL